MRRQWYLALSEWRAGSLRRAIWGVACIVSGCGGASEPAPRDVRGEPAAADTRAEAVQAEPSIAESNGKSAAVIVKSATLGESVLLGAADNQRLAGFMEVERAEVSGLPFAVWWALEPKTLPVGGSKLLASPVLHQRVDWIAKACGRYGGFDLGRYVKALVLAHGLEMADCRIGGTFSEDGVVFLACSLPGVYPDRELERAFHEEVSSLLLRRHRPLLNEKVWGEINPSDFQYGGSTWDAIRAGRDGGDLDASLLERGFLCEYSTASLEQDFNWVASNLLAPTEQFWAAVAAYSRISKKVELTVRFYHALDPRLDREYFERIDRG